MTLQTITKMTLEQVIQSFYQLSDLWSSCVYEQKYSDALINSGYTSEDARDEAHNIGLLMSNLKPYFDCLGGLEQAQERINNYNVQEPSIFILGSGNIGIPLILNIIIGIATGKHVYARPSSQNMPAIKVWLDFLKDNNSTLADSVTLVEDSYRDGDLQRFLSNLPIQQAFLWGGGIALANVKNMLFDNTKVYEFGPRTGVLFIEPSYWNGLNQNEKKEIAQAIYDQTLRYDAGLCSTPTIGFFNGTKEEAKAIIEEIISLISPSSEEKERLQRLNESSQYRRNMNGWRQYGYQIFSIQESSVILALGDKSAYELKESVSNTNDYHNSTGSLEILALEQHEIAELIATLHNKKRYLGIWSVGHIVTVAGKETINNLKKLIEEYQKKHPELLERQGYLPINLMRIVDVRYNLGRQPGEPLDGINLAEAMFN